MFQRVLLCAVLGFISYIPQTYANKNDIKSSQEIVALKTQLQDLKIHLASAKKPSNPSSSVHKNTAAKEKQKSKKKTSSLAQNKALASQTSNAVPSKKNDIASLLSDTVILTGYGAATYTDPQHAHSFYGAQFNPIFLFRIGDILLWESELEFQVTSSGGTDTTLEYASIDWFMTDYAVLVAGKFLSPLGFFIRNLHPAWINELPSKPIGFQDDQAIPPESNTGIQLLGGIPLGDAMTINYAIFASNGPQAAVTSSAVSNVSTDSMNTATKLYGGRIALLPIPSLEIGASTAMGRVAFQDSSGTIVQTSSPYQVLGADINYHTSLYRLRGEYIQQLIPSNAGNSSGVTQGGKWKAYYALVSYRFFPMWEAIIRYGFYSSPQSDEKQHQTALGIDYWFNHRAVAKVAYEFNSGKSGSTSNANRFLLQLAYGF